MLIVKLGKKDKIETALKKFKSKVIKTKQMKQLRDRMYHTKKSVKRRAEIKNAKYKQKKYGNED
tara:strand:+ start:2303 stop:2494 length:192 start_codon:yes stop_codon:yes gene_type:complete